MKPRLSNKEYSAGTAARPPVQPPETAPRQAERPRRPWAMCKRRVRYGGHSGIAAVTAGAGSVGARAS
eukprot:6199686-Pleurochrysis_carterae.AAC.3